MTLPPITASGPIDNLTPPTVVANLDMQGIIAAVADRQVDDAETPAVVGVIDRVGQGLSDGEQQAVADGSRVTAASQPAADGGPGPGQLPRVGRNPALAQLVDGLIEEGARGGLQTSQPDADRLAPPAGAPRSQSSQHHSLPPGRPANHLALRPWT